MLEKDWAKQLFETKKGLAVMTGWTLVYHVFRSPRSPAGFPDWVLVRERIIYAELKREKTKPSDEQVRWLDGIARAGGEVYLWRPSDLEEIGIILGRRWTFTGYPDAVGGLSPSRPCLWTPRESEWTPQSLWLPGLGRADAAVE